MAMAAVCGRAEVEGEEDRPHRGVSSGDGEEANNGEEQEMGPRRRGAWDNG
jgi:hypothetical protein